MAHPTGVAPYGGLRKQNKIWARKYLSYEIETLGQPVTNSQLRFEL